MRGQLDPALAEAVSQLSDEQIVSWVLSGETALFELIVRRDNQRLFRATRAILRDDDAAEDATQDAYLRAFAKLDQFAGQAEFSTWLTKIAVYESLGRLRRAKPEKELSDTMDGTDNPEQAAYSRQLQSVLEKAVDGFPSLYRSVFVMRDIGTCVSLKPLSVRASLRRP